MSNSIIILAAIGSILLFIFFNYNYYEFAERIDRLEMRIDELETQIEKLQEEKNIFVCLTSKRQKEKHNEKTL
jgi:chaperonin cofactor prefoldin